MDLELHGKKVLITASSSGIGLAAAEVFLGEGANVIINGRSKEKLEVTCKKLRGAYGDQVDCFCGDMTDDSVITELVTYISEKYEGLDVLVANLGSGKPESDNPLDEDEWERFYTINVMSEVKLLDRMCEILKLGNTPCVTLISSVIAKEASNAPVGYAAAKSAVRTLNKYLSRLWADDGIRVNCVLPGNVLFEGGRWEELMKNNEEAVKRYINEVVPIKRFGSPKEIADAIVFLSSGRAKFITGAELNVDGGQQSAI